MSTENLTKVFYGFFLVRLGEVGIPHSYLQGLVTEQLLDRGEVRTVHHQVTGEGVAEIVESEVGDAYPFAGVVEGGAKVGDRSASTAKECLGILRTSFQRTERTRKGGVHFCSDLNEDRPRPVLRGRTAREVYEDDRAALPSKRRFKMEVATRQVELEAKARSKKEVPAARRRSVIEVLSRYKLLNWRGNMSTNSKRQVGTSL